MSLTLETREKQKPIILIYGNNPLVPLLLEEYSKEFKIAYVVELEQTEKRKDFYRIPRANVQFVKNLEEKIDYAVIFLSKKEDKNLIPSFMEKISNDGTRTAVIINVENLEDFYDVLLEYKNISPLKFLFLGDVYSENPSFNIGHKLFKIIQQAISEKSIRISQDFEPIFAIYSIRSPKALTLWRIYCIGLSLILKFTIKNPCLPAGRKKIMIKQKLITNWQKR